MQPGTESALQQGWTQLDCLPSEFSKLCKFAHITTGQAPSIPLCDQFQFLQVLPGENGKDSKEAQSGGKKILVVPFVDQILPRFVLNFQ